MYRHVVSCQRMQKSSSSDDIAGYLWHWGVRQYLSSIKFMRSILNCNRSKSLPKQNFINCFVLLIWYYTGAKSCRNAKLRHVKSNLKATVKLAFSLNQISIKKLRIFELNKWRSLSTVQMSHSDEALKEINDWTLQLLSKKQGSPNAGPMMTLYKANAK